MNMQRLDALLAHNGFGSRKEVKRLIRSGVVTVNGAICTLCETHIKPNEDAIVVSGTLLCHSTHIYIMMHKNSGIVSATKDDINPTVMDILPDEYKTGSRAQDLHLIGRLDIDTEGLLLLTTDGILTHRLTSPKNDVDKIYYIKLQNAIKSESEFETLRGAFASGIILNDFFTEHEPYQCLSACLEAGEVWHNQTVCKLSFPCNDVTLTIREGKFHQIKRMCHAIGNEVIYLKRLAVAGIYLDTQLEKGAVRPLFEDEIQGLYCAAGISKNV